MCHRGCFSRLLLAPSSVITNNIPGGPVRPCPAVRWPRPARPGTAQPAGRRPRTPSLQLRPKKNNRPGRPFTGDCGVMCDRMCRLSVSVHHASHGSRLAPLFPASSSHHQLVDPWSAEIKWVPGQAGMVDSRDGWNREQEEFLEQECLWNRGG